MLTPSLLQDLGAYRSQYLLDEAAAARQRHLLRRGFHPHTAPGLLQARHGRHRGALLPRRWRALLGVVLLIVAVPTGVALASRSAAHHLATTYDGPASCASPGFLTGETVGDANPAALHAALCPR
jgi:hypothetical protein